LAPGTAFIVLTVRDSGTKAEREERGQVIEVTRSGEAKRFERTVAARPGYYIADVRLGAPNPAVGNLKAVVAEDQTLVKILGEWIDGAEVRTRIVTSSDTTVAADAFPILKGEGGAKKVVNGATALSLTLVEEKLTAVELPPRTVSVESPGGGWWGAAEVALPPRPSGVLRLKRRVDLEIRRADEAGRSYLLLTAQSVQFPWSGQIPIWGKCALAVGADQVGDKIRICETTLFP
jgi:hypothetical protein